ncbi:DNA-binding transcriptional regulator, FadR family [Sphingobium faniae]|nr:DNA-binding transcriptional regulator, FadR family [Sphingobium faniae]
MTEGSTARSREDDLFILRRYIDQARSDGVRRLPAEIKLTEVLGITRARLSGLLKKLEAEGLIWRHIGKGTFVGERSLTGELDSMPQKLTPPEAFEARLTIEPQIAALAAQRATTLQIAEMRDCIAQMRGLTEFEPWAMLDERLHRLVAKAAGNTLLLAVYDTIRESAPSGMRNIVNRAFSKTMRHESNAEHERYVDAIESHDSREAEALMRAHLLAVRQSIFGTI